MKKIKYLLIFVLVLSFAFVLGCGGGEGGGNEGGGEGGGNETQTTEYTITFVTDCDETIPAQKVKENEKAIKPADPKKAGYDFLGWFIEEVEYTFTEAVTTDITLTAKWEEAVYTVTFETGTEEKIENQEIKYNGKVTKPADPKKEGFKFAGWLAGEAEYNFDTVVTEDLKLVAKWEEIKKYTITFKANGEVIKTVEVEEGKSALAPTAPTVEGKQFVKWEGTFTNVTADAEVIAVYDTAKYVVTFKVDGKTYGSTVKVEIGQDCPKPEDPVKEGFKFVGWDKELTNIRAHIVVNAIFEKLDYTIKYFSGTTEITTMQHTNYTAEDSFVLETIEKEGYYFYGWFDNSDFEGEALHEIVAGTSGDLNLYALHVKADINGGKDCWTTEIPSSFDPGKGIDEISNLPEIFEMDFYKYLKDNNLLNSDLLNASCKASSWAVFSGVNPNHNGDPKRIWNDTSTNGAGAADGYVALFLYDTIELNDDLTVKDVKGGFLGTEPYKTKYRGLLDLLSILHQYKVEKSSYTALSTNGAKTRAFLAFVIDGYFYGTQGAADSYFKAARSVIPGINFSYKKTDTAVEKITYENKGLPTPVKDGYVFAGWCLDKESTKPVGSDKTRNLCTVYASWEQIK